MTLPIDSTGSSSRRLGPILEADEHGNDLGQDLQFDSRSQDCLYKVLQWLSVSVIDRI